MSKTYVFDDTRATSIWCFDTIFLCCQPSGVVLPTVTQCHYFAAATFQENFKITGTFQHLFILVLPIVVSQLLCDWFFWLETIPFIGNVEGLIYHTDQLTCVCTIVLKRRNSVSMCVCARSKVYWCDFMSRPNDFLCRTVCRLRYQSDLKRQTSSSENTVSALTATEYHTVSPLSRGKFATYTHHTHV